MSKSSLVKVLVAALVIAGIVTTIFCYLEKDSAYSALKTLPADADVVFAFDLRSLQEDEIILKMMDEAEDEDWYDVPKDFDWRNIHTFSGAIWLDKEVPGFHAKSFVWSLRGEFDQEMVSHFIDVGNKNGAEIKTTEFMQSDAWEIEDDILLVWVDDGLLALGDKDGLEKFIDAYDGEAEQVGESEDFDDLLKQVDVNSELVIAAGDMDKLAKNIQGLSFSMANGSEMAMSLFIKTDESGKIADLINDGIDAVEKEIDSVNLEAQDFDGIGISKTQAKDILESTSDFIDSVQIDEQDEGVLVQANVDMPEGLTSFSAPLVAVGIPAWTKYLNRSKTTEAIDQLDRIYKGASFYFHTPQIDGEGRKLPCQFPPTQSLTPAAGTCCGNLGGPDKDGDGRCDANPNNWASLTWESLTFQMNDDHYFVYSFESSGVLSEAQFTASAYGDLDCDGVMSTFQRMGYGAPDASFSECSMQGSPAFFMDKETE